MQPGFLENVIRVSRKCYPGKIRIVLENVTRVLENVIRVSRICNPAGSHFLAGSQILVTNKNEFTLFSINLNGWFTIINLVSGALGGGVFKFPNILYNIGIFNGIVCFIFVSFSIYFSLDLLRRFVVDTKLYSYASITQATLGNFWLIAYAVSSFITYMLSISSYLKLLYNYIISIIPGIDDNNVAIFFYYFITYIIEVVLCIFTSNLSKIYILSTICFCIFFIILIKIIIESIYNMSTNEDTFNYITAFTIQDGTNSWEKFLSIMSKIFSIINQ